MAIVRNNLIRSGVAGFIIWGLFQTVIGLGFTMNYFSVGAEGMFSSYGKMLKPEQVGPELEMAARIALNFSILLSGCGLIAIWLAVNVWQGARTALFMLVFLAGLVDFTFFFTLVFPGTIPWSQGMIGPTFYIISSFLTIYGFKRLDEDNAFEKVSSGWVPFERRQRPRI